MNEFFNRAYNNAQLWKIDPMATGEQLYRYRRKNNLTQEGLSELIDACGKSASRVVISKWENGSKTPSLLHLMFLSELYNCSLDELVVSYRCSKERELDDRDQPVPLKITYFIKTNVCVCICSSSLSLNNEVLLPNRCPKRGLDDQKSLIFRGFGLL